MRQLYTPQKWQVVLDNVDYGLTYHDIPNALGTCPPQSHASIDRHPPATPLNPPTTPIHTNAQITTEVLLDPSQRDAPDGALPVHAWEALTGTVTGKNDTYIFRWGNASHIGDGGVLWVLGVHDCIPTRTQRTEPKTNQTNTIQKQLPPPRRALALRGRRARGRAAGDSSALRLPQQRLPLARGR